MSKKEFQIRHGLRAGDTLVIDNAGNWQGNTIPEIKGGTNQTTYTAGDILFASGANTLAKLAIAGNGDVLTLTAGIPAWETPTVGVVTSIGEGTLTDITGTAAVPIVDVDLSEAAEAVYAPGTDYLLFLDGGTGGTAAKESGADFATALAGVGLVSGSGVLAFDAAELGVATMVGGDWIVFDNAGVSNKALISAIPLSLFNDDLGHVENADQNIWLTIAADVAGPVSANTTTDTLTLAGGTNIISTISGDAVTFDWTAALNDLSDVVAGSPTIGAVLFNDGSNWLKLARGTNAQVLTMGSPLFPVWANAAGGIPTLITVADSADPSSSIAFFESPTGDLGPKTDSQLTYDANVGTLTAVLFSGPLSGNASTATLATSVAASGVNAGTLGTSVLLGASTQTSALTFTGTVILDGSVTVSDFGTGGQVKDGADNAQPIGFNVIPVYEIDANDTFDLAHVGMLWHKDANASITFTCASDTTIPQGATYLVHNDDTEDLTITGGSPSILSFLAPGSDPVLGDVIIEQGGIITVYKYTDNEFWAWGAKAGATAVNITVADESTDTSCFPVFVTAATGDLPPKSGSNLTFNSNTGLLTATLLAGGGASITSLTAANISTGSLATGVNSFFTTSSTSSAFKVPFMNNTGTSSVNASMLHDSGSTFTYNPSTNTLTAVTFVGALTGNATTATTATVATTVTVADSANTTASICFFESATGDLGPKTDAGLTYNASTANVAATTFTGALAGNATTAGTVTTAAQPTITSVGTLTSLTLSGDITLGDSDHILFGAGIDGDIFSDGTDLIIELATTADFRVRGGSGGTEPMITAVLDGAVLLYHNAAVKMQTTLTGLDVTGTTTTDKIFLTEDTAADSDVGGEGQIWTKTATPNNLVFTTDSGLDYQVGYARYRVLTDTTLDNINTTAETIGQQHINGIWVKTDTSADTLTLEASSGNNFPVGSQLSIYNRGASGNMTVNDTATQTLFLLDGSSSTDVAGSMTIGPGGYATLIRESATVCVIMGAGLTV